MPSSRVNRSNIHVVWQRINSLRANIPQARVKFIVGNVVSITKENAKFPKGYEQTFSTKIIRNIKDIQHVLQPVYEISDLQF